jgi:hypothetical protein
MSATERQAEKRGHDDDENEEEVVSTKQKKSEEVIKDGVAKGKFLNKYLGFNTGLPAGFGK